MATTDVAIANIALRKLGESETIAAFSDATEPARILNDIYEDTRKAVLRDHPWNFAIKRVSIASSLDFEDGDVTVGTDTITIEDHGHRDLQGPFNLTNADGALPAGLAEDTDYYLNRTDADDFTLSEDPSGLPVVTITAAAGTGTHTLALKTPAYRYTLAYGLPNDYLRLLEVDDQDPLRAPIRLERHQVLTDLSTPLSLIYVALIDDPKLYEPLFTEALAARVAFEIATPLAQSNSLRSDMWQLYQSKLQEARTVDGQEDSPRITRATTWVLSRKSRFGYGGWRQ